MQPNKNPEKKRLSDNELAAVASALTIAAGFAVYWIVQIQDVREMLELAYG